MKQKILSLLLLCCLSFSLAVPASAASSLPVSDVPSNIWYYTYVKDLYDSKVITGITATTFSPQGTVTFGQALKLILLAAGYE